MAFPTELFDNAVLYEVKDGIAIIKMNQPESMNTFNGKLTGGVQVALDLAEADPEVSVVVFTGTGRAFSAGGALNGGTASASDGFKGKPGAKVPPTVTAAVRNLRLGMSTSEQLRNMDKPTIAAVNGACAGAGFAWACACDLRFAAKSAVFKTSFLSAGLSGDYGGTWTLPRIVGSAKAREMYLLNKKVTASDAKSIGLVSDVFPDGDEFMASVLKEAATMAAAPPLALKRIKQNLNDADALSMSDALNGEAERHARTAFHPDAREAGRAFMKKEAGNFKGVGKKEPWQLSKL